MRRVLIACALAALASSAFAATPAWAGEATVESFGTVVAYRDVIDDGGTGSGYDYNDVSITSPSFGKYVIEDTSDDVVAGAGCVRLDAHRAECTDVRITMIYVQLESGDDRLDVGTGTRTEIWAGSGHDTVNGGSGPDEIHGDERCPGGGAECSTYRESSVRLWDTIDGRDGSDLIYGNLSRRQSEEPVTVTETLLGGSGNDTIYGGRLSDAHSADTFVRGGPGADTLIGDGGQLEYSDHGDGVNVSTDGNANDGAVGEGDNVQGSWGAIHGTPGNDTLSGGTWMYGFGGQDALTGDDGDNFLFGGAGTDLLVGNGGGDFLHDGGGIGDILRGGDGGDTADYSDRTANVHLSSDDGPNDGEAGEGDSIEGVSGLRGGSGSDELVGDAGRNVLEGGPGGDLMSDGGGNNDILSGGAGKDAVDYSSRTANLSLSDDGSFNDGEAGESDFVEAESLNAGSGNDTLVGGAGPNDLWGGAGADLLIGGGGGDRIFGRAGNDTVDYRWCVCAGVTVDLAAGTAQAGGQTDTLVEVEGVNGSSGDDTLLGDSAVNLFDGKDGRDIFDGRGGGDLYSDTGAATDPIGGWIIPDTVTYAGRAGSVNVSLDGAANDGEPGEGDNVGQAIENVVGGPGDDALTGSVFSNVLEGRGGADALTGGTGDDTLRGGADADLLVGGPGADALEGGSEDDDIWGGDGLDTVDYTGHEPPPCSGFCAFDPRGPGVDVSLDDLANDGNLGLDSPCCWIRSDPLPAGDNVHSDVDVIVGSGGPDTLAAIETRARLQGMAGDDRLVDGRGATIFEGGTGTDTVDYSAGTEAIRAISIDGVANDGVADRAGLSLENDDVRTDVENIVGGPGPDAIIGSDSANRLTGGAGLDSFHAGDGDDIVNSRDSAEETDFDCGTGDDTVLADEVDRIDDRAGQCESVLVGSDSPVDHFVVSAPSSVAAGAAFSVSVTAKDASGLTVTGYTGSVHFSGGGAGATLPSDYTFNAGDNGSHTFADGVTLTATGSQTITVADTADATKTGSATVNVVSPVSLTVSDARVTEGAAGAPPKLLSFAVSLSATSTQTVTVDFATADGTANSPGDYAAASGTLTFMPGTRSKTVSIQVNGDDLNEPNETFSLNLSNATGTGVTIADGQAIGTIVNDDLTKLAVNDIRVDPEGNTGTRNAVFTVSISKLSSQTVTVNYATSANSALASFDFTTTSGTATIAAGQTSTTVAVPVLGETLNEADESFFLNLSSATVAVIGDKQAIATIVNDDPAPTAPPTITSFSPTTGITGSAVVIKGTNFTGTAIVKFNGKGTGKKNIYSATQMKVFVPDGATSGRISVTTVAGTAVTTTSFTVTFSATSFTPATGAAGTTVTVNGVGFNSSSVVKFNGVAAATALVSPTQLTAIVPAAATTGRISVTNTAAPLGTVYAPGTFTKT